ncbi:MAG: hypothetical protein GY835_25085 [bacterium]|nr:hypothetical protein [bacterium]
MQDLRKLGCRWFVLISCLIIVASLGVGSASANPNQNQRSPDSVFGQLFTGSPCDNYGSVGCTQTGAKCNLNWHSYFTYTTDSITMTAGNDCRTVNTYASCQMTLGEGGVTQISFDFDVSDACHGAEGTAWLAFWIYRIPWNNWVEVDFIESKYGPSTGLNTNFAGKGDQVIIFDGSQGQSWKGSITAKFSGTGNAVDVQVSNSVNSNVGSITLTANTEYFFVMDTAPGSTASDCTISVSNVQAVGSVASRSNPDNCVGLKITPTFEAESAP